MSPAGAAADGPLVLGFTDAAGRNGAVAVAIEGGTAALLLVDEEASAGEATELEVSSGSASARVEAGSASLALRGSVPYEPPEFDSALRGAAILHGEAQPGGKGRKLDGFGHLTRWRDPDPWREAEIVRHLVGALEDGSVLVAVATRPPGAAGHGDEEIGAWLIDPEGVAEEFGEPLISTQYDGDGLPTRAGLELWGADEEAPARRAAAIGIAAASLAIGDWRLDGAFVRWSFEGRTGFGSYLIWTR